MFTTQVCVFISSVQEFLLAAGHQESVQHVKETGQQYNVTW